MPGITYTQGAEPHRIALITRGRIGEGVAGNGSIKQGFLVERNSVGKYVPHSTAGGSGEAIIALENGYVGYPNDIEAAYPSGDIFPLLHMLEADVVYGRVAAAAAAIADNDLLASAGDGTVMLSSSQMASLLYEATAASAAVTTTASETAFDKSYTIPANFLRVGDVIHVVAQVIATATNSTDTLTLKLKIGSTVIVATAAVDVANNDIGYIEADLVIRSIGASGTFVATGVQGLGVPGTVTAKPFLLASTAIDTTATQALTVSATWSTNNAGNSCRLDVLSVEMNRGLGGRMLFRALEAVDNSAGAAAVGIRMRYVG